jgi:hypothetical protein
MFTVITRSVLVVATRVDGALVVLTMPALAPYFDASGHNGGPHAVTVGGFISDLRAWGRYNLRWREALDRHGITDFRMSSFVAGAEGFEKFKYRRELQAAVLSELAHIIRKNTRFSVATSVITADWRAVDLEYRMTECRLTEYAVAAFSVTNKTIQFLANPKKDRKFTEFVFEEGDAGQKDFEWLVDEVVKLQPDPLSTVRPKFQPKTVLPLQSADFAVWEQRSAIKDFLEGSSENTYEELRPSLRMLLEKPNNWGVMARAEIVDWAIRLSVPKRSEAWDRKTWRPRFGPLDFHGKWLRSLFLHCCDHSSSMTGRCLTDSARCA